MIFKASCVEFHYPDDLSNVMVTRAPLSENVRFRYENHPTQKEIDVSLTAKIIVADLLESKCVWIEKSSERKEKARPFATFLRILRKKIPRLEALCLIIDNCIVADDLLTYWDGMLEVSRMRVKRQNTDPPDKRYTFNDWEFSKSGQYRYIPSLVDAWNSMYRAHRTQCDIIEEIIMGLYNSAKSKGGKSIPLYLRHLNDASNRHEEVWKGGVSPRISYDISAIWTLLMETWPQDRFRVEGELYKKNYYLHSE